MGKIRISHEVLRRIKAKLQEAYGERLQGVVLYGSEARGEAEADSDIDLLVLLDGNVKVVSDLKRIIRAIRPIQLEIERPIHATPAEFSTYHAAQYPLYRHVKAEGILL